MRVLSEIGDFLAAIAAITGLALLLAVLLTKQGQKFVDRYQEQFVPWFPNFEIQK